MATLSVYQQPLAYCPRASAGWSNKPCSVFLGNTLGGFNSSRLTADTRTTTPRRSLLVVSAAKDKEDAPKLKKKVPSAVKRAKQAEKRRMRNKGKKSEIRTRMKKVFVALDELKKKAGDATQEELKPIEVLIGQAYSSIDRAVKVRTLHRNTGGRRKSRLARAKKRLELALGWYVPEPPAESAAAPVLAGVTSAA